MRVGQNPSKEQPIAPSGKTHQVVIPVYIPHQNDYYAQSFEVFQLCITSLLNTCHVNTSITVVNNGSCEAVKSYLDGLLKNKQIDELVHTGNIGKLNAILKGLCGHRFPWVTLADADTFFLNDWQKATYKVFEAFPKTGVVGLTPQFKMYKSHSNHVLFDNFFSKNLKFQQVKEPEALQRCPKNQHQRR
jgi:cellulose synthase/poly-beta-1,6-N-acetylglucosamine synthase-like glycosyltransferase